MSSSKAADDDEPMWLQLSGALVPGRDGSPAASSGKSPMPPGAAGRRSHSAEWRAQFEARSRLAEAATPEPPLVSDKAAGKARAVSEEEPDWLQSAGAILEPASPSMQQGGYITPALQMPSGMPSAAAPPPRQSELTVADLEPDSFLAQLIMAAGPAPGQAQTTIL